MPLQSPKLVAQRIAGDALVFLIPGGPIFPLITAAPAGQDENAHPVSQIEEMVVLNFPLETNRIEIQIANVIQFGLLPFR